MADYNTLISNAQALTVANGRTKARDSVFTENALSYIATSDAQADITQWAFAGNGSNTSDVTDLGDGSYRIVFDSTPSGGWGVYRRNDMLVSSQGDYTLVFDILVESVSGDTSDLGIQVRGGATYTNFYFKEFVPTIENEWRTIIGSDVITDNDIRLDFGMNTVGTASVLIRNMRFVPVSTVRTGEVARVDVDRATVNSFPYYGSTEAGTYNAVAYEDDTLTASPTTTAVGSIVVIAEPVGWTGGGCPGSPNGTVIELGSLKITQSGSDWLVQNDTGTIATLSNLFATSDRQVIFIDWDGVDYTVQLNDGTPSTSASSYQPTGTLYIGNNSTANGVFGGKVSALIYNSNLSPADKTTLHDGITYIAPTPPLLDYPDMSGSTGRQKIIFVPDSHYYSDLWYLDDGAPALGTIQKLDSIERMDLLIQKLNAENADFIFFTGDITHNDYTLPLGFDAFADVLDNKLSQVTSPFRVVNSSHEFYTDEEWALKFNYLKDGVVDFGNYAFVVLNNWVDDAFVPGQGYNYTEVDQTWLQNTMDSLTGKTAVYLVSHYINSTTDTATRTLLQSYPNYSGAILGHLHNRSEQSVDTYTWLYDGQFSWPDAPPWDDTNPWGFRVVEIDSDGIANSYMINIEYDYPNGLDQQREEVNHVRLLPGGAQGTAQTPVAPTITNEDTTFYQITFTAPSGYYPTDCEFSYDSGSNWTDCTSNVFSVPYGLYSPGEIQVRVKQLFIDNVGVAALSTATYSLLIPPTPTNGVVDDKADTFAWDSPFQCEINIKGAGWVDATSPYYVGDNYIAAGDVQVRVKEDPPNAASLILVNDVAFNSVETIFSLKQLEHGMIGVMLANSPDLYDVSGTLTDTLSDNQTVSEITLTLATAPTYTDSAIWLTGNAGDYVRVEYNNFADNTDGTYTFNLKRATTIEKQILAGTSAYVELSNLKIQECGDNIDNSDQQFIQVVVENDRQEFPGMIGDAKHLYAADCRIAVVTRIGRDKDHSELTRLFQIVESACVRNIDKTELTTLSGVNTLGFLQEQSESGKFNDTTLMAIVAGVEIKYTYQASI